MLPWSSLYFDAGRLPDAGSTERADTQGVTPPPGSPTPAPARMTFFVTSAGLGKGGDLGGLGGADAHCQALAAAAGAGGHTWHAYLSTQARPGQPAVNARDRCTGLGSTGRSRNWGRRNAIISANLANCTETRSSRPARQQSIQQSTRNEHGQVIHGIGDAPPIQHEILTDRSGTAVFTWITPTILATTGPAVQPVPRRSRHSDRIGNGSSWNSSNATKGCSQAAFESSGGAGLFHCFAIN